jgi:hypothetical protein
MQISEALAIAAAAVIIAVSAYVFVTFDGVSGLVIASVLTN